MMPMHAQALHTSIVWINKLLLQHEVHSKLFLSWTDGPYFSKANTCMCLSILQKKELIFYMWSICTNTFKALILHHNLIISNHAKTGIDISKCMGFYPTSSPAKPFPTNLGWHRWHKSKILQLTTWYANLLTEKTNLICWKLLESCLVIIEIEGVFPFSFKKAHPLHFIYLWISLNVRVFLLSIQEAHNA